MDSKEYKTQKFVSQYLAALKSRMLTAVAEVNKWKRVIFSQHDAHQQAMLEYMTKAEFGTVFLKRWRKKSSWKSF